MKREKTFTKNVERWDLRKEEREIYRKQGKKFIESGERDSQKVVRGDSQKVERWIPRKWGGGFSESGEGDSQKVGREIPRK